MNNKSAFSDAWSGIMSFRFVKWNFTYICKKQGKIEIYLFIIPFMRFLYVVKNNLTVSMSTIFSLARTQQFSENPHVLKLGK